MTKSKFLLFFILLFSACPKHDTAIHIPGHELEEFIAEACDHVYPDYFGDVDFPWGEYEYLVSCFDYDVKHIKKVGERQDRLPNPGEMRRSLSLEDWLKLENYMMINRGIPLDEILE